MINRETSWLSYTQTILKKVSFDPNLFKKELQKALKRLNKIEISKLENWCIQCFTGSLAVLAVQVIQEYLMISTF